MNRTKPNEFSLKACSPEVVITTIFSETDRTFGSL
jgi:hypothetical protein